VSKGRLEAFSDAVIAIIITIMVLELKVPHGNQLADLRPLLPVFLSYLLSYIYIGIYWNNHHHLFQACRRVTGGILWANLFAAVPTALYGVVLLAAAYAYIVLQGRIVAADGPDSPLARALGRDRKGQVSRLCYGLGVAGAFYRPWIGWALYVTVALIWFVPDRRIERQLRPEPEL
jgi:uncharacterized membrane protein